MASLSLAALFSAFKASSRGVVLGGGTGWVEATVEDINECPGLIIISVTHLELRWKLARRSQPLSGIQ